MSSPRFTPSLITISPSAFRARGDQSWKLPASKYLAKPDTAVIISYSTPGAAHWTVLREIGRTQLTLRDSSRGSYLALADFVDLDSNCSFQIADTLVISR